MTDPLDELLGPAAAAFRDAARRRQALVAPPRPALVAALADPARVQAWLAALLPIVAQGRSGPRATAACRERAAGAVVDDHGDAFEYVAIVAAGRERWTLHDGRAAVHDLEPGALVYVPAGTAVTIATTAAARIWYLGFAFPTWIDVVANTAMLELATTVAWRTPVAPGESVSPDEADAIARALAALRALSLP